MLPSHIPQIENWDHPKLDWKSWNLFIEKACKGSHKAPLVVRNAGAALVWKATGSLALFELDSRECAEAMERMLPASKPDPQSLVKRLAEIGGISLKPMTGKHAIGSSEAWGTRQCNPSDVVHHAVRMCSGEWSGSRMAELYWRVSDDDNADAVESVAAMIFVSFAWELQAAIKSTEAEE